MNEFFVQLLKKAPEVCITALGFFLALYFNSLVEAHKNKATSQAIMSSVREEARSNHVVLTESFERFFRTGVVLRHFSVDAATEALKTPLFYRYQSSQPLTEYLRALRLSNRYAERSELSKDQLRDKLIVVWEENLKDCKRVIENVAHVANQLGEGYAGRAAWAERG